jgi:hypothetical protein
MTAGPGPRVAALLELLRPVAAELVVALDDRADEATERAIAGTADELVRYPYREPVDRPLRWLFSLCGGDWILNLDDDEVPGAELLAALPGLVEATDVTHYWLLRRWLWPDEGSAIADHPWSTDYQLRLVRNDPLLLRFPSETHRPIEALGPHRFVRAPLYHADLVLNPEERRLAKARRYEALRPGKRVGGGPMNHVFHLPERRPGLRVEAIAEEDAALVRAVLEVEAGPSAGEAAVRAAGEEEIDRLWAGRETEPAGRLELLDEPRRMQAGEQRTFDLLVENGATTSWPGGERGEPEIRVSYRWLGADGGLVEHGLRTPLPAELPPGGSLLVPVHVLAPARPGRYRLRFDLVHEHVSWFGCDVEAEVEVERRLRVGLIGDEEAVARTLERLTEEAPGFEPVVFDSAQSPRYGPERAPDLRRYLLAGTPGGRVHDLRLLASRTVALADAARKLRDGTPVRPLLRGAQGFLDELAGCTHLLLLAGTGAVGTRELWLQAAAVEAARRLGVEVLLQDGALAEGSGEVDRRLARAIRRRASVVAPGELGLR